MLYHEVGVDPKPETVMELGVFLSAFGFHRGRLISRYPQDWSNKVRENLSHVPDQNIKLKISSLLSNQLFLNSIVDFGREKLPGEWLESASRQHFIKPFNALINLERNDPPDFYSLSKIDNYINESEESIGELTITNTSVDSILSELKPFLRVNKKIVLENYGQTFLTQRKTENLFKNFFKLWSDLGGRDFTSIVSLTRLGDNVISAEIARLEIFLKELNYKGNFKLIAVNDDSNRLHERYLLGPFGGIEMGYGLETTSQRDHTWKILNKATFIKMKSKFFDQDIRDIYLNHRTFFYSMRKISDISSSGS